MQKNHGGVPTAHTFTVGVCGDPNCQAVHIELKDTSDTPFATFAIAQEDIESFFDSIIDAAHMAKHKRLRR
jgi:hypothetical protein